MMIKTICEICIICESLYFLPLILQIKLINILPRNHRFSQMNKIPYDETKESAKSA